MAMSWIILLRSGVCLARACVNHGYVLDHLTEERIVLGKGMC